LHEKKRKENKTLQTPVTITPHNKTMSADVTGMMVELSNENNDSERGRSDTPSTVGQASVTPSYSEKIKQLDDNCLFGEYRNIFNTVKPNKS
jgi:hypothetical protein